MVTHGPDKALVQFDILKLHMTAPRVSDADWLEFCFSYFSPFSIVNVPFPGYAFTSLQSTGSQRMITRGVDIKLRNVLNRHSVEDVIMERHLNNYDQEMYSVLQVLEY